MLKMSLSLMMFYMSIIMFFLQHPLSLGLMILIQTLTMCLLTGMMLKTYWFSYILFLTFLGGLLVLFIYISSIASNELFKFSIKSYIFFFIIILFILIYNFFFNYKLNWMNLSMNSEMFQFFNMMMFLNNENKMNLNKLYNNQTFFLMIMLMIYLFITLIIVVKIININYGPLRSSSN